MLKKKSACRERLDLDLYARSITNIKWRGSRSSLLWVVNKEIVVKQSECPPDISLNCQQHPVEFYPVDTQNKLNVDSRQFGARFELASICNSYSTVDKQNFIPIPQKKKFFPSSCPSNYYSKIKETNQALSQFLLTSDKQKKKLLKIT